MKQLLLITCALIISINLFSQITVPHTNDKGVDLIPIERVCCLQDTIPIQMLYTLKNNSTVGRATIGYIVRLVQYISRKENECDTVDMIIFHVKPLDTLDYYKVPIPSNYKILEIHHGRICTNKFRRTSLDTEWGARGQKTFRSFNGKRIQTIIYESNNRSTITGIRSQQSKGILGRWRQPEQRRSSGTN